MIVADASVLVATAADDGADGDRARVRLRGQVLVAPELVDLEVSSVLRRLSLSGRLPVRRAEAALADLVDLPLQRAPHLPLLPRCWSLRHSLSVYDASYVALAEALDCVLLTADGKLSRAPGLRCTVDVLHRAGPAG